MSKEIKARIDELTAEMEAMMDPTVFVLNPRVSEINTEIASLQKQCAHSFKNGVCEFCYRGESNG